MSRFLLSTVAVRRAGTLLLAGALAVSSAGCGADPGPGSGGLALVVAPVASVPDVSSSPALAAAVDAAARDQSTDVIVVADGDPHVAARGSLALTTRNEAAQAEERARLEQELVSVVRGARPDSAELDLLNAVALGAREIAATAGRRTLLVVASGLSTVAPLAMQDRPELLRADPADVVAALREAGELPDLSGIELIMSGFGDTAGTQPAVGGRRTDVISLWRTVFSEAGAQVTVDDRPISGRPVPGLPPVTPVLLPLVSVGCTTVLPDDVVAFRADSSDLVDEAAALAVIRPLAARLSTGSGPVTVAGTTARVGPTAGQQELGRARARKVADLIVSEGGVDAGRITAVGLGSDFPEYVVDHGADGELLPGPAAANRTVRISVDEPTCGVS